jgi:septal ring factor EnvC (AmiA/AmiB activator)
MRLPRLTTLHQHKLVVAVALAGLGVTCLNFACFAQQDNFPAPGQETTLYSSGDPDNLSDRPISTKIDRIQQEIAKNEEKIKSTVAQGQNIHKELQRLDNELKVGQHKLTFLQERLLRQENHIQQKEHEIELIQSEKETIAQHVEKRLQSFYQRDEISIINTLFSASTLPELLNLKEYFSAIFRADQLVLHKYSTKIDLLIGARAEIQREKETLLEMILEAKKQEELLIAARQARKNLLTRVQTEEILYRHALDEIKVAALELTNKINSLSVRVIHSKNFKVHRFKSNKKRPPEEQNGFSELQGKLTPPAAGKIIKSFGTYVDKFNTEATSSGINIETDDHTEVKAIYAGIVVFKGEVAGYGNMVVIDHGQQYHSLVSGLESILVEKGDKIATGQTLGIMGSNTTLLSRGLHLEIRYEADPVDPLLWLDKSKLTIGDSRNLYD